MIRTTAEDGGRIVQGIEYDRDGRRVAYWLHPDHPGDGVLLRAKQYKSVRVPADTVAHLFERQRVQDLIADYVPRIAQEFTAVEAPLDKPPD